MSRDQPGTGGSGSNQERQAAPPGQVREDALPPLPPHYFELYQVAVDSAHRTTAARATANAFFFTLQGVLAVILGLVQRASLASAQAPSRFGVVFASIVGLLLTVTWLLLLRSYKALNSNKFKVILAMEERLAARPFAEEWKLVKGEAPRRWRDRYAEQGTVEQFVPVLFGAAYLTVALWGLLR